MEIKNAELKVGEYVEQQCQGIVVTKWHDKREVSLMSTIIDGNVHPVTISRTSKDPSKRVVKRP